MQQRLYGTRVVALREAIAGDGGTDVMEAARALIDRLEVHAPTGAGGAARLELDTSNNPAVGALI
jgi:hypothetical protein